MLFVFLDFVSERVELVGWVGRFSRFSSFLCKNVSRLSETLHRTYAGFYTCTKIRRTHRMTFTCVLGLFFAF